MHAAVHDIWIAFNKPLEGIVTKPYADVKGLVTVGMGNLIDPIGAAMALPWKLQDGTSASAGQIISSWNAVKLDPECAKRGWTYSARLPGNIVHLTDDDVDALIYSKLALNDALMASRFGDWEARPADAQLAVHSMAWAMGPAFWGKFPKFTAAFTAEDYARAALECSIMPEVGTIVLRNRRNKQLLTNAMTVSQNQNADRSILLWS